MANTLIIGNGDDKLYEFSGEFSSTIKTSQYIGGVDQYPNDLCYDGNTPWTGDEAHALYLTSGKFSSTIKDSIITTSVDNEPLGVSSNHGDTPWLGGEAEKMYLYSGQFTSTIITSEPVHTSALTPHGIAYTADKYAGYTMYCDRNAAVLFLHSGVFTSTVKDSQLVISVDTDPQSLTYNGTDTLWVGIQADKMYMTSGRFTSTIKTSQYIGGIDNFARGIETTNYEGRTGSVPDAPTGVNATAGVEKNTITWTTDPDSTSDNIYWTTTILPNDDFSDIDDWTAVVVGGSGTVTNPSGTIRLDIPDSGANTLNAVNDYEIPDGDFEIIIDIVNYVPDDYNNGFNIAIRVRKEGGSTTDFIDIQTYSTSSTTYEVRAGYKIGDVFNWFSSGISIGSQIAGKLRVRRISTTLYVDYYANGLWSNAGNFDFTSTASLLSEFAIRCQHNSNRGGYADLDNFVWKLKANGTKITSVTSPYDHTSLTPGQMYYYVVTGENYTGESDESTIVNDAPLPDEPENVLATPGILKNTISWDSVSGADKYNLYWLGSSPVTKGTGNKIADVSSPYVHQPLTGGLPYYYVITAEANSVEGNESSEVNATPFSSTPDAPQNLSIIEELSGDSQTAFQWDIAGGSTSYNIYFIKKSDLDNITGIKTTTVENSIIKQYGTKISGITDTQYIHYPLTVDDYYYKIAGFNENGEGDLSDVLIIEVMFEGKIFDHNSEALLQLAYQYRGE